MAQTLRSLQVTCKKFYYTENKDKSTDKADTTTTTKTETEDNEQGAVGGAGATAEPKDTPPLLIDGMECLPFQLQISYNNLDGAQCNRVITQSKPVTKDRQVAEAGSACNNLMHTYDSNNNVYCTCLMLLQFL